MWSKAFAGNLAEFHSSTPSCEKRWWREYHVVRRFFSSRDMETCEDTKQHRRFSKNISECKSEATIQYMEISYKISYNYLKVHSCSHIHLIKFEMIVKTLKKKISKQGLFLNRSCFKLHLIIIQLSILSKQHFQAFPAPYSCGKLHTVCMYIHMLIHFFCCSCNVCYIHLATQQDA